MLLPSGKAKNDLASDAPDAPCKILLCLAAGNQQFEKLPTFCGKYSFSRT